MTTGFPIAAEDERAVVACCLDGGLETSSDAVDRVPVDAFVQMEARTVFFVISEMVKGGVDINSYTVALRWKEQNRGKLPAVLTTPDPVLPTNLPVYAETVLEAWRKRRLMEACEKVIQRGSNPLVKSDELLVIAEGALQGQEVTGMKVVTAKDAADRLSLDLERRAALQGELSGIGTGFYKLDDKTDGLQYGEMTVIGARPNIGKTALGLNFVEKACLHDEVPTLVISLEMSIEALMRRMLCSYCGMEMGTVRKGSYGRDDLNKISYFYNFIQKRPIHFIDGIRMGGMSAGQIASAIRRRVRKDGVKLVVIDYLQKIKPDRNLEKKTYEIGETSGTIKNAAENNGVALVALAQLSRESVKDKPRPPRVSDLADSGQIDRDGDTIILLHRDFSQSPTHAQFIVAKQRDGETGAINQTFNGKYCRFENPKVETEPEEEVHD